MGSKKRLVDIDRIKKLMLLAMELAEMDVMTRDDLIYSLDNAPTEDAVEVVRCKDCAKEGTEKCPMIHRDQMFGNLYSETKPMGFCSYGERKADEN